MKTPLINFKFQEYPTGKKFTGREKGFDSVIDIPNYQTIETALQRITELILNKTHEDELICPYNINIWGGRKSKNVLTNACQDNSYGSSEVFYLTDLRPQTARLKIENKLHNKNSIPRLKQKRLLTVLENLSLPILPSTIAEGVFSTRNRVFLLRPLGQTDYPLKLQINGFHTPVIVWDRGSKSINRPIKQEIEKITLQLYQTARILLAAS